MTTSHKQTNIAVRYQFVRSEFDEYTSGDPNSTATFPARDTWEEAARDAVDAGRAEWVRANELRLLSGEIKRVRT